MKEKLLKLGITPEQVDAVLALIPKDESRDLELKNLKYAIAQRDAQIASLKSFEGDAAALKKQLDELQKQNAEESLRYKTQLAEAQKRFAVKQALLAHERRAHDLDMAMSQFDLASITLDDKGQAIGIKEQHENLIKAKPFLFAEPKTDPALQPVIHGLNVHPKSNDDTVAKNPQSDFADIGESIAARALSLQGIQPNA